MRRERSDTFLSDDGKGAERLGQRERRGGSPEGGEPVGAGLGWREAQKNYQRVQGGESWRAEGRARVLEKLKLGKLKAENAAGRLVGDGPRV